MERRAFLKAMLAAPVIGVAVVTKAQSQDVPTPKAKEWPASVRIMDCINEKRNPRKIFVASDVFAELTDEFASKCNVYIQGKKPRPMYFCGLPVQEVVAMHNGEIVVSEDQDDVYLQQIS